MEPHARPVQTPADVAVASHPLHGDPRGLRGTARSQPVGSCCAVLGWRLQAGAPLVCVCPKTAGVAGSPHPQALDRPLLGTPGSCLAPSQCSLIILGHPQVPGQAVALRWGPCMSPTLSHPPTPGLGGSSPSPAASSPAGLSSRSGHSCQAPDSPAACCVRSNPASLLPLSAGTTPGPRAAGPGMRPARQGCTVLGLLSSSVLSPLVPGHCQGWGPAREAGRRRWKPQQAGVGLRPGSPACLLGFPTRPGC